MEAFVLYNKKRFEQIKKELDINEIHLEKQKGNWKQNLTYCIKDNNNIVIKDDDYEEPIHQRYTLLYKKCKTV